MKKQGITLLLAIFIGSLALTLGIGVFTLVYGELGFSGTSKDSLVAFFSADSGIECALYWDIRQNAFATSTTSNITCDNDTATVGGSSGFSSFVITFSDGSCTTVTVAKGAQTTITSLGQNLGDSSCRSVSNRVVQRGLEVSY